METPDLFHFDENRQNFEMLGQSDKGTQLWYASDLMDCLGYTDFNVFERTAINRAITTCMSLKIPVIEHFIQTEREINGKKQSDYKLSRFACYLTSMNGDTKKPQVAKAQTYFALLAETLHHYQEEAENVERVRIRSEVSEHEKSLSGIAHSHGVENYAFFQNAGYRGLYNMNIKQLEVRKFRGQKKSGSLLDYMGKTELAANLFRVTQTEEKIKRENVKGQTQLEHIHEDVGCKVREAMLDISNTKPEDLPLSMNIKDIHRELKQTQKKLLK